MTRNDLISALARQFPERTGESSLEKLTTEEGRAIFKPDELGEAIRGARDVSDFMAICGLRKEFNSHFDKLGEWMGKAATVALYYQLPRAAFLKLADKAFAGAEEAQRQQGSEDPKKMN